MELRARMQPLLDGPLAWHEFVHEASAASTNDLAAQRIRDGAPSGVVIVADEQTAGRGRMGRNWEDRPGGSLLVSVTVPAPETDATLVPLAAGIAVVDAAHRQGVAMRLKWPNDLLVPAADRELAKCGGILAERIEGPGGPQIVVGIGIDVDWRGADRSGEAAAWTSLAESSGNDIDRADLLVDILRGLDTWVRDLLRGSHNRITDNYLAKCATIDRDVVVTTPDGQQVRGRAIAIAKDGSLVIDLGDRQVTVSAGDVEHAQHA